MIFVTVGTTLPFDSLLQEMDRLVREQIVQERVICQIGMSTCVPEYCEYFRFKPSIDELFDDAAVVICHGGTGTVFSLIQRQKPFVAVANPRAADDHQGVLLAKLEDLLGVLWTRDVHEIASLIERVQTYNYGTLPPSNLPADIIAFVRGDLV